MYTRGLRLLDPVALSLAPDIIFKFGHSPKNGQHKLACAGGGIDAAPGSSAMPQYKNRSRAPRRKRDGRWRNSVGRSGGRLPVGGCLKPLDSGGGRDRLEHGAQKILDLEKDPAAAKNFARNIMKPGAWAKFQEYWINALLSGPRTHATDIASNTLTALWSIPELR